MTQNVNYYNHLSIDEFDSPVIIQIFPNSSDVPLPVTDIRRLLEEKYSLSRQESFDVALSVDSGSRGEISFDGSGVESVEEIIQDVREMINNYNKKPDDFDEWDVNDWENMTVDLQIHRL